ncbi:MAG: putative lipoprotein [Fibrobacteres bacterium]|nr:putative lipoprotein [Fibrobacterota bacterium]
MRLPFLNMSRPILSSALIFAAFLPAALALSGCVTDASGRVDLSGPRAKWKANEPAEYAYTIRRFCECIPGTVMVTANRDSVVSAYAPGFVFEELGDKQRYSIDSLFSEVETALARSYDTRSVGFDDMYGFPDSVSIDFEKQVADEEFSLFIQDFRKLGFQID